MMIKYPESFKQRVKIEFPNCPKLYKAMDKGSIEAGVMLRNLFNTKRKMRGQEIELKRIHGLIVECIQIFYDCRVSEFTVDEQEKIDFMAGKRELAFA